MTLGAQCYGSMLLYGVRMYELSNATLFRYGTFGVFREIVRIQVEYRMLRGTQVRAVRLYEPTLRPNFI